MNEVGGQFEVGSLSLHQVGSWGHIQIIRFRSKLLYPLSYIVSLVLFFKDSLRVLQNVMNNRNCLDHTETPEL